MLLYSTCAPGVHTGARPCLSALTPCVVFEDLDGARVFDGKKVVFTCRPFVRKPQLSGHEVRGFACRCGGALRSPGGSMVGAD